jgi:hypothetical protein
VAEAGGLDAAAEHLLGHGAALGPIAPGHLAIDDDRTQRLFGAPVRGVERGIEERAEDGGKLRREMRREAVAVRQGRWAPRGDPAGTTAGVRARPQRRGRRCPRRDPIANVAKTHSHQNRPPTFQRVSSGLTVGRGGRGSENGRYVDERPLMRPCLPNGVALKRFRMSSKNGSRAPGAGKRRIDGCYAGPR